MRPKYWIYYVYPRRCLICDKVIRKEKIVCWQCMRFVLKHDEKNACYTCGLPKKSCICPKYLLLDRITFPLLYQGDTAKSLSKFKFRLRIDKSLPFAILMHRAIKERKLWDDIDVITYIPMTRLAIEFRGYNQSELLAKDIAKLSGKPCLPLLQKYYHNPAQHKQKAAGRRGSVLGLFEPVPGSIVNIKNKRILIVDDVYTTGSTLNEAAKTLLIFGADTVSAATATRTPKNDYGGKSIWIKPSPLESYSDYFY